MPQTKWDRLQGEVAKDRLVTIPSGEAVSFLKI